MNRFLRLLGLIFLLNLGMTPLSYAQIDNGAQQKPSGDTVFKSYFFLYGGAGFLPGIESMLEDTEENTGDKAETIPLGANIYGGISCMFYSGQSEGTIFALSFHFERIFYQTFMNNSIEETSYEFDYPYKVFQAGIGKGFYDFGAQRLTYVLGGVKVAIADSDSNKTISTSKGIDVIKPENLYGVYGEVGGVFGEPLSLMIAFRMGLYFGGYETEYLKPLVPLTFEVIAGVGFSF